MEEMTIWEQYTVTLNKVGLSRSAGVTTSLIGAGSVFMEAGANS